MTIHIEDCPIEQYLDVRHGEQWRTPTWQNSRWQIWKRILDTTDKTPHEWLSKQSLDLQDFVFNQNV